METINNAIARNKKIDQVVDMRLTEWKGAGDWKSKGWKSYQNPKLAEAIGKGHLEGTMNYNKG